MSKRIFKGSLLATTVIAGAAFAGPVYAQDATPTDTQGTGVAATPTDQAPEAGVQSNESTGPAEPNATNEIVVTGTLIRNPNLVASAPVTVVGQEEIQLKQSNVAEEVLRTIPGAVPSIGSNVNNGNGGASYVNLRGLGSNRNIVLLDGTRIVPSDLVGRVDLNNIPLALVDRVDVLTGGASSTYGADAVGGVVNFITRKDFAGLELQVSDQISERGDGNIIRADMALGANFDDGRGNAVLGLGYQESDAVYMGGSDRPQSEVTIESYDEFFVAGQGSSTTTPSAFDIGGGRPRQQVTADGTGIRNFYQAFNFNPYNVFQTPFKRYNMFSAAHYDVADNITVYARGMYSNNTVDTIIAPSGSFASRITVPVANPFLSAAQRSYFCANADFNPNVAGNQTLTAAECAAAAAATSATDPNYREFQVNLRRRTPELGPRVSNYNTEMFDFKAGVRGDITDSIGFDVFGSRGQSTNTQKIQNYLLTSRLRDAVRATSTTSCLSGNADCVPANIFGPAGSITPEMADYLSDDATSVNKAALTQVRGVLNGDVGFSSPWASEPVGFAVGTEYRKYTASQQSDSLSKTAGELGGAGGAAPDINGGYSVYEGYAEVIAPLVSDKPGFNELTVEAGIRRSSYSVAAPGDPTFKTTTWKVAGNWEPISDLKIRGNYQKAVRAPNISELFSPVSTGLTNLGTDPCAGAGPVGNANLTAICVAQGAPAAVIGTINQPTAGQANATGGGNLNLKPETARTWTVGAVLRPSFLSGFTATVDYYHIKVTDAVSSPTPQDAIAACFGNVTAASASDPACTIIRRNPQTGALDGDPATTPGLFLSLSNLGTIETDGIDVTANYKTDLGTLMGAPAKLNLSFGGNWTNRSLFQASPTALNRECTGYYSVNCGSPQPEFSFNQRTTLSLGDLDLSVLWRYIDDLQLEPAQLQADLDAALDLGCTDPNGTDPDGCMIDPKFRKIKAYNYFDLAARWNVNDNMAFTFTVLNLFDKKPPYVGGTVGSTSYNGGNTYPSTYDAIGRRFAASARLKF